jgi:hypothetical protein
MKLRFSRDGGRCAAIAGIVLAVVMACAAGASGAGMPAGGKVKVFATPKGNVYGTIVITGAIGDYGKTTTIDKNGKPDGNGNYVKIALQKGTFEVDSTKLNAISNKAQPDFDKATCSYSFSATAPVKLFNGTGLYEGLKGSVNITLNFGFVGADYKTGPHKGQCNTNMNAPTIAQYGSISGTGSVSFS